MNQNDLISIDVLPVDQPIGTFYIGAMDSRDLITISWADIRRIGTEDELLPPVADSSEDLPVVSEALGYRDPVESMDEDLILIEDQGFEKFLGIQRELNSGRVAEIQKYVETVDASFPTAVLLAISSDQAQFDEESGALTIVRHTKSAKIIDGQHRIAGLRNYSGTSFQVNVAIFIDMDIQDQAMVFATINLTQTKVNKSLAYDLYEFTTSRSPQKSCHDIVRYLNYKQNSPFKDKIKMLGRGRDPSETITQATFVDRLLRLISRDPMDDRDKGKRGKKLDRATRSQTRRQIFRNFFIDEEDAKITVILWNFFLAVAAKWPRAWEEVQQGNVLNRTTGFGALMRFLRVSYLSFDTPGRIILADRYRPILDKIDLPDMSFTPDQYLPGSSGEKMLFDEFVRQSGLSQIV